jgi:uncharacterized circularly permuted ATP-grasp superfamily protein/uncharacterized alpha-E superfamily protein
VIAPMAVSAVRDDMKRERIDSGSFDTALIASVRPGDAGHFSELFGEVRSMGSGPDAWAPHWRHFFEHLGPTARHELDRRARALARQVRDNGITYNIYADQDGPQRPWSLDLLPLIVTRQSWQEIEAGVLQRARLCESIMADIYGEQRLLRDAMIPPALVHGHSGYLREMRGQPRCDLQRYLHIVAFDLVRCPDGRWAVVSQRTQAPSGLGYLLENRLLVSTHFPSAFESMAIAPIAPAYQALVASLKNASPAGHRAHVALLTPGPYNETYFEHAYLARHLGLTLVEGHDLTVREDRLYLRTLGGLEQVDVLLKRLDDEFLDPLELRPDSTLGVPGLLQAVRAGQVIVANTPGSGFLESPGLMGFLPAISEILLGQSLCLPAMDSWWCGEAAAMEMGLAQLRASVIKRTYPRSRDRPGFETTLGGHLSTEELGIWEKRIRAEPDAFTLQRFIPISQTPVWQVGTADQSSSGLMQRSAMLRVFAVRGDGHEWQVLPGGLLRLTAMTLAGIASMQRGGSSADVWVQADMHGAARDAGHLVPALSPPVVISTVAPGGLKIQESARPRMRLITSRAAENLFWFGRYTERSENSVRLARLILHVLGGERPPTRRLWSWLLSVAVHHGLVPEEMQPAGSRDAAGAGGLDPVPAIRRRPFERMLIAHLNDGEHVASVGFNLRAMQQAASVIRERLSIEQWNVITRCVTTFGDDCRFSPGRQELSAVQALQALSSASGALAAITGAQLDRMTRDEGWQLLALGRHIERLGFLSDVLCRAISHGALSRPQDDDAAFLGLLVLYDSTITYRAQHQQSRSLIALIDLLVSDPENPRSLAWVATSLRKRLQVMFRDQHAAEQEERMRGSFIPDLSDVRQLIVKDDQADGLSHLLEQARAASWRVSDLVGARYFSHIHETDTSIGS